MEPRNSIPDLFYFLSYLQGLSKTSMNALPVRKTATRRHSILLKHSLLLKISVNKEPRCLHCNQKFASLLKTKRKTSKAVNQKKTILNQLTKESSLKASKKANNLFMYKATERRKKKLPTPENLSIYGVKGWVGLQT